MICVTLVTERKIPRGETNEDLERMTQSSRNRETRRPFIQR